VSDPKKVHPRFAAIAEEIDPTPPPQPRPRAGNAITGGTLTIGKAVDAARDRRVAIEARAGQLGLVRALGETDDALRDRVALLLERASELSRGREGGRELVMYEGREHFIIERKMAGFSTEETFIGNDGRDRVTITIKRQADMRDDRVFGADGGYAGRIKR
jgi:hypothetical protein